MELNRLRTTKTFIKKYVDHSRTTQKNEMIQLRTNENDFSQIAHFSPNEGKNRS